MIVVVGAGIIGVTTALELQKRGHRVILIDKGLPGQETSFGNAGVLSESSFIVVNSPEIKTVVAKMLLSQNPSLRIDFKFMLSNLSWFFKFLKFCNEDHMRMAARSLRHLQTLSLQLHGQLLKEAGAVDVLRNGGWLKMYRTKKGYEAASKECDFLEEMGVAFTAYNSDGLARIEPNVKPIFHGGILIDDTASVSSPLRLIQTYVDLFCKAGGELRRGNVGEIVRDRDASWLVKIEGGDVLKADHVVVATGPWAPDLLRPLGYKIPMAWERGYHVNVAPSQAGSICRPIFDVEGGYVMSPMEGKLRILTGVEINHRDARPRYRQLKKVMVAARQAYDYEEGSQTPPWLGSRPTLADSLPMVGPAPRHKGVWFNFGHQHIGLSTATGCAHLLADQLEEQKLEPVFEAFLPARFAL